MHENIAFLKFLFDELVAFREVLANIFLRMIFNGNDFVADSRGRRNGQSRADSEDGFDVVLCEEMMVGGLEAAEEEEGFPELVGMLCNFADGVGGVVGN